MNDWQKVLEKILKEKEEANQVTKVNQPDVVEGKRQKRNRGRGVLPLLRPTPRTHRKTLVEDDGPPIHNWRGSPMER